SGPSSFTPSPATWPLSAAYSVVCLPSCSKTILIVLRFAAGAPTATSTGVLIPTNFSGFAISIEGPPWRPATTYAPPAARRTMRMSAKRYRMYEMVLQSAGEDVGVGEGTGVHNEGTG